PRPTATRERRVPGLPTRTARRGSRLRTPRGRSCSTSKPVRRCCSIAAAGNIACTQWWFPARRGTGRSASCCERSTAGRTCGSACWRTRPGRSRSDSTRRRSVRLPGEKQVLLVPLHEPIRVVFLERVPQAVEERGVLGAGEPADPLDGRHVAVKRL